MTKREQARAALGGRLRELRCGTGMTGGQFAAKLGWYGASRVSKLELGQQDPSEKDLLEWVTACGSLSALPELKALLYALDTFYRPGSQRIAGVHAREHELMDLEWDTGTFRVFASAVIPDLLQTPEYVQACLTAYAGLHRIPATCEEALETRRRRQGQLHMCGKDFHFILAESVLSQNVAGPEITIRQAEKLLMASLLGNVRIGVIPSRLLLPGRPGHGFTIHDSRIVLVETLAAEMRLADHSDISTYTRAFDQMAQAALYGGAAQHHIRQLTACLDKGLCRPGSRQPDVPARVPPIVSRAGRDQ